MRQKGFETNPIYQETKLQIVGEIDQILKLKGLNRLALSKLLSVQPSAVTQQLDIDKGMQLVTLVRMADVLDCYIEFNLVLRGNVHLTGQNTHPS